MSWIRTRSSGWVNADHVTRLFITNDVMLGWQVKASMPGPQQPIVVKAQFEEAESAAIYLENVIRTLNGHPQETG